MKRATRTSAVAMATAAILLWNAASARAEGPPPQPPEGQSAAMAEAREAAIAMDALSEERPRVYDPAGAGHPLRMAAYVVHPVGVILDVLIFRPLHWIGHLEPFKTLFGQSDAYE